MPSGFISTLSTVMSQTSLTLPTPFPVSSASLDQQPSTQDSVSRTTSKSTTTSSNASTTSSKSSSSRTKNLFKKLKEHKEAWWTISAADRAEYNRQYNDRPQPVVHEWNYMYL